ncbi:MAG: GGDEF domain-containing protein [Sphingomonas bacterium]|nr:GGDEF domain-containing protein [Sphingomonas bacterium]
MHGVSHESRDPADLLAEIAQLKADVARLEEQVGELDQLAHLDALVPLANRRGMLRELETMIARHERYGSPAAVLFVDLDGLKLLNDSFGHEGGDAALVHVAQHLQRGVRSTDCVARLGGDEFCILLHHADEERAIETARRLANLVAGDDFLFDGQPVPLSVAIGMTVVEPGDTPTAVLARADQAMYRVKVAA